MSLLFRRKNIFDILNEADDDQGTEDQGAANDAGGEEAQTADAETTDDQGENTDDGEGDPEEEMGSDDDYNIDTTMDNDEGGEDTGDDTDEGGDDSPPDTENDAEGEVNKVNTNIFASLTKEEQAVKIKELKRLYNDLYIYIGDMYNKINDIYPDENNIESIYRISSSLYDMKKNISEYISSIFDTKTYIENDIAYNRYLTIIQSITTIITDLYDEINQKQDKK